MFQGLLNKKRTKRIIFHLINYFVIFFLFPFLVQAQDLTLESISGPFGNVSLASFIAGLIKVFLGIIGVIFILLILYAGFNWMTAGGDPNKVDKAKKIITASLIGLTIIISAFAITSFLMNVFGLNSSSNIGSSCQPGTINSCVVGEYCPGTKTCNDLGMWGVCIKDDPSCQDDFDNDPYNPNNHWSIYYNDPFITYISPAKDIENNNPDYGFWTNALIKDDIPNGAPGNYITIWGRHFGNVTGTVIFKDVINNTTTTAPLANCMGAWKSNQIIVEVPYGLNISNINYNEISSTTEINYQVAVITAENLETATASATPSKISNYKGFLVNNVVRPGICSTVPSFGAYPATTTISGNNFPTSGIQNVVWSMRGFDSTALSWVSQNITSTASNWTVTSTIETLPENKKGRTSIRIYNGSEYSNYYVFLLSTGKLNDPCGYDSNACNEDIDTCALTGLKCQFCQKVSSTLPNYNPNCNPAKNCTCQPDIFTVCENGEEETCSIGGCSGKKVCVNGQWSDCQKINSECIPYLGMSTSTLSVFTWPFIARKNPKPGMSCSSELWNDETCNLNGCVSKDLFCKIDGSDKGFIEIYNPTSSTKQFYLCPIIWSKKAKELNRQLDPNLLLGIKSIIQEEDDGSIYIKGGPTGYPNTSTKIFSENIFLPFGDYNLFIKLKATTTNNDSFMYHLPGMSQSSFLRHIVNNTSTNNWQWQKIKFSLSSNTTGTIEIAWRETNYFDFLFLSKGDCNQESISANSFKKIDLPVNDYNQFLLVGVDNAEIFDSYLINSSSSAFYPYSFGRIADGDKGNFVYFASSTPGASNGVVASGENLADNPIINEVSLSSGPCICVQKGNFCKPGEIDRKICPKIGKCDYIRICDANGYFGTCVKADPNCIDYPIQATSTLSIFTWSFLASAVPPAGAFQVVVDCNRSPQCLDSDLLPSPTPWPNKWNTSTNSNLAIEDSLACTNSVISARFTMPISTHTLNSSTLKIFKQSGSSWIQQTITDEQIEKFTSLGEGGSDTFQVSGFKLEAGAKYRVLISKDVLSETGLNLVRNNEVLKSEDCANTNNSIISSSSVAFCWNFEVRPEDKPCPVGCINCSPKNYFNRYFGQKRNHTATPISEDNVCLMLSGLNYAWDWYEQHQNEEGWVKGSTTTAFSVLLDLNGFLTDVYNQSSGTSISGKATTTAQKESGWRKYVSNILDYFKDGTDKDFFKITAEEKVSTHPGSCPAHNDFSSVVVVENQYCTNDEDKSKRIMQSPSPWKGQQDACRNAVVFVLFNRNIVNSSVTNNIIIQKCDSGKATSTIIDDCDNINTSDWTKEVFSYSHPNLSLQELMTASVNNNDTTNPEGVRFIPPEKFLFDENSWYRVIIKGGNDGVRGASTTPQVEVADGTLVTPTIPGTSYFDNGRDDYFWYFKTGSAECPIEGVNVLPQYKFLLYVGLNQEYTVDPWAANCNHLNPEKYNWDWRSLISLNDENADCSAKTGESVATICNKEDNSCTSTNYNENYIVKVFAKKEGQVKIKARAKDTRVAGSTSCQDDKYGYGTLQIGYGGFRIINYGNDSNCLNSDIYFIFSSDAKGESISYGDLISDSNKNKNVGLYKCNNEECSQMTYEPFTIVKPENSGTISSNPSLVSKVILRPNNNLSTSTSYRVIVRGGTNGVKSFADDNLEGLNYSIYPNSGGEVCDPSVYPWREGDPDAGKCDDVTCKFVATSSLCGTISEECKLGSPYCNSLCQKTGNDNIASCGNGIIEPGEDCDDSNATNEDGCSSSCLWEGSNGRSSRCKNGKVEYGEQCDFGSASNNTAKGCDPDSCLWVSGYDTIDGNSKVCTSTDPGCNATSSLHTGSLANVPVCGNKKIELGEQCDDGSSNGSTTRCSSRCLLNGFSESGSTCKNGRLENGQHDSFSWVFRLSDSAVFCEDSIIEANPCPNGIWRFKVSPNVISYNIKIYKGQESGGDGCIKNSEIGFWRRILNTLVNIVRRIFGFRPVVAANYWCEISNEDYSLSDLSAMDKGNYKRDINIESNNIEVIAYSIENNFRVINYIPLKNFDINSEYLAVTNYTINDDVKGTTTARVNTYETVCKIREINVEVWPKGLVKQSDGFFCFSDLDSGKPDECGRYSDDPYDDDMSAAWTKNKNNNGYDLRDDGSVSDSSGYKKGNQHLYRYWALGDKDEGNGHWPLRANFVTKVFNINAKTVVESFSSTKYSGDSWVTSGPNPGKTILNLTALDSDSKVLSTEKNFPIITYFCNNPWPDARNFPFLDNSNNCTVGSGTCHNTNFGTYYCRDAGIAKTCIAGKNKGKPCNSNNDCDGIEGYCQIFTDDDLPSISKYDGLTGKLKGGIITGMTGDDCDNLPADFVPAMGVYYENSNNTTWGNKLYLWSKTGDIYSYNTSKQWNRVDKGYWQKLGLPSDFKAIVGYSYDKKLEIWNNNGDCKVFDGNKWKDCIKTGLPNGFVPKVGYYYNPIEAIGLIDANGNYYAREISEPSWQNMNQYAPTYSSLGINGRNERYKPIAGYYGKKSDCVFLVDANQKYIQFCDNGNGWTISSDPGLPSGFKLSVVYYDDINQTVQLWDGQKNIFKRDGVFIENKIFDKTCDNKVKEFLFGRVGNLAEGGRYDFSASSTFNKSSSICDIHSPSECGTNYENYKKDFQIDNFRVYNFWDSTFVFDIYVPNPGKYYLLVETSNLGGSLRLIPPKTNLSPGATSSQIIENTCGIINGSVYHNIGFYFDNQLLATTSVLASSPQSIQITKLDQPITISQPGNYQVKLIWNNNCDGIIEINDENINFDSNLAIYKISLVNMDAADTLDAIGIRVYANNNHYAPDQWYSNRFNLEFSGEKMIVNGYEAIKDGRTVYVNSGDLSNTLQNGPTKENPQSIFSNIYLMSFSQGASQALQNIFKQMINNWFFNAGDMTSGGLEYASALGKCEEDSIGENNYCITDIDCLSRGKSNCSSYKAKLTRDVKRLGDLQKIASQLLKFYNTTRCSNDFNRFCKTNSDCYGGGACGNYYPALKAGTYISGKTFSVWPSWQNELGKALNTTLPTDPINKFEGCLSPYNSTTCWNQETKKMSCSLTNNSAVYAYYSWDSGKHYQLMAKGELSDNEKILWSPAWSKVDNFRIDPFASYESALTGNFCKSFYETFSSCNDGDSEACNYALERCGNGIKDEGENCNNCWLDAGCGYGKVCSRNEEDYTCKLLINCGDGIKDFLEECDCGNEANPTCSGKYNGQDGSGCSASCQCYNGYNCFGDIPLSVCGDGIVQEQFGEQCDFKDGLPTCYSFGGENCCGRLNTPYACRYVPITVECRVSNGSTACIEQECPPGYSEEAGSSCVFNDKIGKCSRTCIPNQQLVDWFSCNNFGFQACDSSIACPTGYYLETPCQFIDGVGCRMGCRKAVCGNGVKEPGENCDCGNYPFSYKDAINAINFNPYEDGLIGCEINNTNEPNDRYDNNFKGRSFEYCKLDCTIAEENYLYCGDGIIQAGDGELCDIANYPPGSGLSGLNRCNTSDPANQCKTYSCPSGSGGISSDGWVWCAGDNVCNGPYSVLASGLTSGTDWGELKTNTCDNDCRECNASDACCDDNCNRITSGTDPHFPTVQFCGNPPTCKIGYYWSGSDCVCDTTHYVCNNTTGEAVYCYGAAWSQDWDWGPWQDSGTISRDACTKLQYRECIATRTVVNDVRCDSFRGTSPCSGVINQTQWVSTGVVKKNDYYCCRNNGENWTNETACDLSENDSFVLKSKDTDNFVTYEENEHYRLRANGAGTVLVLKVSSNGVLYQENTSYYVTRDTKVDLVDNDKYRLSPGAEAPLSIEASKIEIKNVSGYPDIVKGDSVYLHEVDSNTWLHVGTGKEKFIWQKEVGENSTFIICAYNNGNYDCKSIR